MKKLSYKIALVMVASISFLLVAKHTYAGGWPITASAVGNGSISPSGMTIVGEGLNQTYTITPDTGYGIRTLDVDSIPQTLASEYTFYSVSAGHTIDVSFERLPSFISTSTSCPGGRVAVASLRVGYDTDITSVSPLGNFTIEGDYYTVTADGTSGVHLNLGMSFPDGTWNLDIAADTRRNNILDIVPHSIPFTLDCSPNFEITATAGAGGRISPSGIVEVNGSEYTFALTPDSGYEVDVLLVDSIETAPTTPTSYTFVGIREPHTIDVTFKRSGGGNPSDNCTSKWDGRTDYYKFDNRCESWEEIQCRTNFGECIGLTQKMKDLETLNTLLTSLFGFDITLENVAKSTAKIVAPVDFVGIFQGMFKQLELLNTNFVNVFQKMK